MGLAARMGGEVTSVGDLILSARAALEAANEALSSSGLTDLVAKEVMRGSKRRGRGSIRVDDQGRLMLRIGTHQEDAVVHTTAPGGAGLPSLDTLRMLAEQRGVDISDLGRKKREIMRRLSQPVAEGGAQEEEGGPPDRLRDEVRTSTPLPDIRIPR